MSDTSARLDPIGEMRHHTTNSLEALIRLMKLDVPLKPDYLDDVRGRLVELFKRFDGTKPYVHTPAFNPEVATSLQQQAERVIRPGGHA